MKKQLFTIFGVAMLSFASIAQRDPNLIPCATDEAMEEGFKKDPNLRVKYNLIQSQMELDYKAEMSKINSNAKVAVPVYTIPIVFHIMGNLSITDAAFTNLITYVNNDFAKTGSDVGSINSTFAPLYVDSEIKFALAQKDPNGNCTNGIIRHDADYSYWSQTSPAYNYSGTGTNRWPTNKYLNVYIVECISSTTYSCPPSGQYIGGYTYLPGGTPYTANGNMGDAIVLLRNQVAVVSPTDSRTISHEIGHWLNLLHVWGSTNQPGVSCGDDNVSDTPLTKGLANISTCPSSIGGNTCDPSNNDNIENIMHYATCPKMFTQGQTTRMRSALTSSTGGRNNLWTPANLVATGISTGYTCSPAPDFEANKVNGCAGNSITYTSNSQVGTSGSVSWIFQGGSPATSTATSQVVTYASPGSYSVSLTATNPNGSNTMTKTSYITVVNGAGGALLPAPYDFQGATLPSSITVTNNNPGSPTWIQNNSVGANGTTKSIYINNASSSNTPRHVDIFETDIYDFSNTTGINFSYYYSYAKRLSTQSDTFKVQYSLDCGGSWANVVGTPNTNVMSASGGTSTAAFVPATNQWVLKTYVPSLLTALANKPSVKFRFWFKSDGNLVNRANNIYIDQINITGSVVTAITEIEKSMDLVIYPNPTASTATIDFTLTSNKLAKINVIDVMGRVLEETTKTADNEGHVSYIINKHSNLASGVYFVNIDIDNQRITKKIIIE
jgi:PKD repeat protein